LSSQPYLPRWLISIAQVELQRLLLRQRYETPTLSPFFGNEDDEAAVREDGGFGPRFARCTAAIRLRPGDLSSADQDARYGLELRIEPLEMMADFRHEPARKIAERLRERALLLERAATSLER
jgi:hypothetical protein